MIGEVGMGLSIGKKRVGYILLEFDYGLIYVVCDFCEGQDGVNIFMILVFIVMFCVIV